MSSKTQTKHLNLSVKSFLTAIIVIFSLMVITYVLTLVIPAGEYKRVVDANGQSIIDMSGGFTYVDGGIPFWKWLLSPVLVLGANGSGALIAVIAFLLVIGGIFTALDRSGIINYVLSRLTARFYGVRYKLMAVVIFFFMALGAMVGSFEEVVPLVPIVVALSVSLGWNALIGIAMSLLAVGCGFASGVFNPFTVGVAQQLASLPMFSGMWLRLVAFLLIYALLFSFTFIYAKKIEKPIEKSTLLSVEEKDKIKEKSAILFASILGFGILLVLCSSFISFLQDYTMIIVAVTFLIAGFVATLTVGMKLKLVLKYFLKGVLGILPAVLMILMASSIKYTMEESLVLDTVLHGIVGFMSDMPKWAIILFVYLLVLVMNFFIPSGSAKAFMLIPIILPIAQIFGVSMQLCIVAFAFGDGFSNVFYPTNSALLISLGLVDISYGSWFKFCYKFQLANLVLTSLILLFGLFVGY
jgi:uncharacterized ion transporter superfamily protein YfcC